MTTYDLFRGSISQLPLTYPDDIDAITHLEATENIPQINRTRLQLVDEAEEATDTRIGNILDNVGWAAGMRNLDAGVADCAALTDFTGSAWSLIRKTVEVEQGNAFVAGNGDFRFLNRVAHSSPTSAATFGDGNLSMSDFQPGYDDKILVNLAEVKATATATPQTASDATSIANRGTFDYAATNISLLDDNAARNVAEWIVGSRKDYNHRIAGFTVHPQKDGANLWPVVLSLDLGDVVTVNYIPPAGDTYNQQVVIDHISHVITAGDWICHYRCHPLSTFETQDYWVLGTSALDTGTRLA